MGFNIGVSSAFIFLQKRHARACRKETEGGGGVATLEGTAL